MQVDVEKFLLEDIKAKKYETASLRSATKHRRLGKGSMKFASDLMSRKEKKEYMKAGEILTSNLYDTILPVDEFMNMDEHDQKNRLQYWRLKYSIKEIMSGMGIYNKRYYEIIDSLGLPKDRGKSATRNKPRKARITEESESLNSASAKNQNTVELPPPAPAPVQEVIVTGMHLVFNGTYTPEEIQRQLLKYATLMDGEDDDFYLELKITQKPKKKEAI
jgi:hypothetical protein